ncbi:MAG TPA: gamma-glutamyltransferase, partial [Streptosporangiaceae bacterium]|nr:gamma-glutamyltransferase [Streptosporangiaceae bacterium]
MAYRRSSSIACLTATLGVAVTIVAAGSAAATPAPAAAPPPQQAVAVGTGGGVASDNVQATQAGTEVLRHGGNAVDAAVAVAATLGVTDPFVAGIGGGGFLAYYDARTRHVYTIDGRETTPASAGPN